jgi:hypothetical protein
MIFDILKGIVLVVFTIIILILGWVIEIIATPSGRYGSDPLINNFINDLWKNSYKH